MPTALGFCLCVYVCAQSLSHVAHKAPLSMGFSKQEYQSELPCPLPGDLPNPVIKPRSPALQVGTQFICVLF